MNILEVAGPVGARLEVPVESIVVDPVSAGCGERAWVKEPTGEPRR